MFSWHLTVIVTHNLNYIHKQPPLWSKRIQLVIVRVVAWETEAQGYLDTIYDTEDFEVLGLSSTGLDKEQTMTLWTPGVNVLSCEYVFWVPRVR